MRNKHFFHDAIRKGMIAGRFFTGRATGEERADLAEWRAGHESLLEEIASPENLKAGLDEYEALGERRAWPELQARVGRRGRRLYRRVASTAAAVALCATGIYLWSRTDGEPREVTSIAPGTYRATLHVGDELVVPIGENASGVLLPDSSVVVENNLMVHKIPPGRQEALPDRAVVTPRGGEFALVLPDGTRAWLNAESRLGFPAVFGDERVVTLSGEAYFEVARDERSPFVVMTGRARVQVLGTSFNACAYPGDSREKITLEEGSIEVRVGEGEYRPLPGEQLSAWDDGRVTVTAVDAGKQGAWREGKFVFERDRLDDIMNRLARWYNVQVVFADARAGQLHFSGELNRYSNLERLLDMLELTTRVEFVVEETTVTIHSR
ncbi:MAG: DUF4974 domain-containing protein [Odoribacteraceae bacterium]|jgi:ferric-dicitrate binding protein FerR (iron transport regulator)|nr:DUF4974 domain-containing protein [Odoribacteraceae bacterium]